MTEADRLLVCALARTSEKALAALKALQRTPYREHGQAGQRWKAAADRFTAAENRFDAALLAAKARCHEAYQANHGQGGEARAHG